MKILKPLTYEDYFSNRYIVTVKRYSNSGKTYYGVVTYIDDDDRNLGELYQPFVCEGDELVSYKKVSELSEEELLEHKKLLDDEYNSYLEWVECVNKKEEEEESERESMRKLIKENRHLVEASLPFILEDDYDTYRLRKNISDGFDYKGISRIIAEVHTMEQFDSVLDEMDKYFVVYMLSENIDEVETWWWDVYL